jgi:hypothetical protein
MPIIPLILTTFKIRGIINFMTYHHRCGNLLGAMLKVIGECSGAFSWPLEYTEEWRYEQISKAFKFSKRHYNYIWRLKKRGLIAIAEEKGIKF